MDQILKNALIDQYFYREENGHAVTKDTLEILFRPQYYSGRPIREGDIILYAYLVTSHTDNEGIFLIRHDEIEQFCRKYKFENSYGKEGCKIIYVSKK